MLYSALPSVDHLAHVAGVLPRHEDLVHWPVQLPPAGLILFLAQRRAIGLDRHIHAIGLARAEDFLPCSRCLRPVGAPDLAEFRGQRLFMLLQVIHQLFRHGRCKSLVGRFRPVARVSQHAHFVLHLHHQHGMLVIGFPDVPHQGAKGARIRVPAGVAERAQQLNALTAFDLDPREPFVVLLDPERRVARQTVLPTAKPQEHQFQAIAARFLDEAVHQREIEVAFLGLQLGPRYRRQHAVQVAGYQPGPERLHVLQAAGGVVAQFPGEREERFPVHHQLCRGTLFLQMRNARGGLSICLDRDRTHQACECGARKRNWFHNLTHFFRSTNIVLPLPSIKEPILCYSPEALRLSGPPAQAKATNTLRLRQTGSYHLLNGGLP